MSDKKPTIQAKRRRPAGTSAPTGRAEAPRRRPSGADAGSGGLPPTSGAGGSSLPSLPGGSTGKLSIGGIVLLVIVYFVIQMLGGGGDPNTTLPGTNSNQDGDLLQPTQPVGPAPTATRPRPTRTPSAAATGDTWLILLYQDADDKILEQDIHFDLNEAERIGSNPNVQIVAQIDRFQGGYQGGGDWTSARRYYVTQDDDLQHVNSELVQDLGEINMADGKTLVDFATWAIETYPADKVVLILSDHGMGWPGGWSDPTSRSATTSFPLAAALGDQLYLNELDDALAEIRSQTGLEKFELIGMDACLMGHLEVLTALAPHARYAITSQETEPALGWAYAAFLNELNANPGMDGAALGEAIVNSYIQEDQRILDEQERANLVGRGSLLNSLFGASAVPSASQVSSQMFQNVTLSAVDLAVLPELLESFNELTFTLQEADQRYVAQARSSAQSFTSIFGKQVPPSYIDLGQFAELVSRTSGKRNISQASTAFREVLARAVVAEVHGKNKPGATGISIYFPNSNLYSSPEAGMQSYTVAAQAFAGEALWDEFLAFHYTGRAFQRGDRMVTVPDRGVEIKSPASGGIQVTPLEASALSVEPGESIELSSEISGANIGYVRLLVGFLDETNNSIYLIDSDYLESPETRELNGVYYPDWGANAFTLEFAWEPIVFAIEDGVNTAVALFTPESYGASPEDAVYSVEGIYTYADSGEQRYARLYFSNGQLNQVFGFTGSDSTGAPREIIPKSGDSFTILEKWMDIDSQGKVTGVVQQEGETLTFSQTMFTWTQLYAAAGEYMVGFIVEDLDGKAQTVSVRVTVR